jgi:hydrogenase expression/formation protein HypE
MTDDTITMAHGSGGAAMHRLIREIIAPALDNEFLAPLSDQATMPGWMGRIAFTTDSYVVQPLFFPGGDIGKLAVCGTVNDLVVGGAIPRFVSLGLIVEEGFPLADLRRILASIRSAADEAGVRVVTGDTKVVERGAADGMFINTAGIGEIPEGLELGPGLISPGDKILLSGTLGDHGTAVMIEREGLRMSSSIVSDCAPLCDVARSLLFSAPGLRMMRDPTRGGLASALCEIAGSCRLTFHLTEDAIPVKPEVQAACDILGLDPLYVANEGKIVAFVAAEDAEPALAAMKQTSNGADGAIIGEVADDTGGLVLMRTGIGGTRVVQMLTGELLPRIC